MTDQTIWSYFQKDHEELDSLFDSFQVRKACDFEEAKTDFEHFRKALFRHIAWEEELLFPLFEAKTGLREGGPTAVMRAEHQNIKEILEKIDLKLRGENADTDEEEAALLALLSQHNCKEESILYPAIDRSLDEGERARVFELIKQLKQAFP